MAKSRINKEYFYEVMHKIFDHVKKHATKGNVDSVIETIDKYFNEDGTGNILHIGKKKGLFLESVVKECQPTSALELGAFFGYSALRIARLLKPGAVLYTIDLDSEMVEVTNGMIQFAGMEDRIKVINGKSSDVLARFHGNEFAASSFDFVLLDHHKPLYKPDLVLMEELKLLKNGCVILADNLVRPGVPDYAEYVRNSPKYQSTTFPFDEQKYGYDEMEKSVYLCG